jgi:hypothetical protein
MRFLIDTQIFIWAVMDSENLSAPARRIMLDATEIFGHDGSKPESHLIQWLVPERFKNILSGHPMTTDQ